uniref:Dynein, axonemal, intermediate chain 2b n=1 Tax=Eptatretus burgeri TaxID=7764 RepID=A0A8C4NDU1_EPTBU
MKARKLMLAEEKQKDVFKELRQQFDVSTELQENLNLNSLFAFSMAAGKVNTIRCKVESRGMNHLEGGWPKDVDPLEVDQTLRFRKRVERDENYLNTIVNLGNAMEHYIKQNNCLCLDKDYFESEGGELYFDDDYPSIKTINFFRDPNHIKRTACHLSWHPDGSHKFAVAYGKFEFQRTPIDMCLDSYIWDIENPLKYDMSLKPASALLCLEFNPKDSWTLIGGCYNGQLAFWDTRNGSRPVDITPIEQSHRGPAFKVIWHQSKSGTECFSSSSDGQVLWWDVRKLNEPLETLVLDMSKKGNLENALGAISLEYESTMRNFFFPKIFLTVGDWRACIWSEDVHHSAIISTKYQASYLTNGCWSPARPSVFFISKMDGTLDIWDFLNKRDEPTLSMQICDEPLSTLRMQDNGQFLACGSHQGTITLMEVSSRLYSLQHNEKTIISVMFQQERKREKILATRLKEQRLKEKGQPMQDKEGGQGLEDAAQQEDMRVKAEKEFFEITKLEFRKIESNPP